MDKVTTRVRLILGFAVGMIWRYEKECVPTYNRSPVTVYEMNFALDGDHLTPAISTMLHSQVAFDPYFWAQNRRFVLIRRRQESCDESGESRRLKMAFRAAMWLVRDFARVIHFWLSPTSSDMFLAMVLLYISIKHLLCHGVSKNV